MALKKQNSGGTVAVPNKTTLNLAASEEAKKNIYTLVIGVVLIAVLCFCAAKFGVIDQQTRLSKAQSDYSSVHATHEELLEALDDYPKVLQEYATVSAMNGIQHSDDLTVDRRDILDVFEAELAPYCTPRSLRIAGNILTAEVTGISLQEASSILEKVEQYDIVTDTIVNYAKRDASDDGDGELYVTVTIYLAVAEEEDA